MIEEFGISAEVEEEIIAPTPYPLMVSSPEYAYLILHFPTTEVTGGARNQEIDVIVGKKFLITARYEVVQPLAALHKAFEAEELLGVPEDDSGPVLVERVLRRLYQAMADEVERIAQKLERIEADIFSGKERTTVRAISEAGRVLLRFDTALARHGDPLDQFLTELETSFFGKKFSPRASRIRAERAHAVSVVAAFRAAARDLRTTNDSLLSASQSEALKIFTMITVAFLPLTFIAGLFGMHTEHEPITGHPQDFWLIIIIMIVVELLLILLMRLKKWI